MGGTWWVTNWLSGPNGQVMFVSYLVWIVGSIVLHELAHGWVAIRCGDDVPLHSGHMTINPFVHIPPMAWIMFALTGITWGLMPTNPYNYKGRFDEVKVALAGPAMNILLALVASVLAVVWSKHGPVGSDPLHPNVFAFLTIGLMLNMVLAIFNLLPVPPLDGSRALGHVWRWYRDLWQSEAGQIGAVVAFAGLFFFAGERVWLVASRASFALIGVLQAWL
jgi:Zn-dependent protease